MTSTTTGTKFAEALHGGGEDGPVYADGDHYVKVNISGVFKVGIPGNGRSEADTLPEAWERRGGLFGVLGGRHADPELSTWNRVEVRYA